jgi:DUF2905 family protein
MEQLGRMLLLVGGCLALLGLIVMIAPKLPLNIHYQRDNFSFYFPLGASILLSLVLTLVFSLLNRR